MSLAAGAEHSLAVSAFGQVFSWGCGSNGRLGHAQSSNKLWFWNRDETTPRLVQSFTEKAVSVSCGHMHSGRAQGCCACQLVVTQRCVLACQFDTKGYAGSWTLGILQVVLTQMEGRMPGVMAPIGSLAQGRLWMQACPSRCRPCSFCSQQYQDAAVCSFLILIPAVFQALYIYMDLPVQLARIDILLQKLYKLDCFLLNWTC